MSTSQASLEIFALVSLALLFLSLVSAFYLRERNATVKDAIFLEAKETVGIAASAIDQVYLGGSGYSKNITLPATVGPYNYSVYVFGGHAYIVLSNYSISVAEKTIPPNVSGNFSAGKNRLSNSGGIVSVGQ
ncbi:MAG: hypothetical protein V1820_04320 [archaeon]